MGRPPNHPPLPPESWRAIAKFLHDEADWRSTLRPKPSVHTMRAIANWFERIAKREDRCTP